MTIKILITGGTFDKEYNELNGQLSFTETHIPEMLKLGRSTLPIHLEKVMLEDSLNLTEPDRIYIAKRCLESEDNKIVITHGTDTMVETAKVIAGLQIKNKTIVLTGALIPYRLGNSDGLFNLGSALAFVQTLSPGVYITMNGKCFNWDKVRKNKENGYFEEVEI